MKSQALHSAEKTLRSTALTLAAVAAAALLLGAATGASAQSGAVFREVKIDLSGLPQGAVEAKRDIAACLAQSLPLAFAGRVNPSARQAPVLVVRPTVVWLSPPVYGSGDDRSGGHVEMQSPDVMEGEAIIAGARVPLMVSSGAEGPSLGAPEAAARRRTDRLCQSFAYWLARKI
jgi:hypothetical protein